MANITVLDSDGTTNRVFTALNPAGGDGTSAIWRWEDSTKLPMERVRFEVSSSWNAQRTARKVQTVFIYPITRATAVAGVNESIGSIQKAKGGDWLYSQVATDAQIASAAKLYANLMASTLVQSVLTSGYAPN